MPLFPVGLTLLDAYGRTTTRSFLLDDIGLPEAKVNVGLWVTAYQAITGLQVVESRLIDLNTYSGAPAAGANVDVGATFSVQLDTPNKTAAVKVPGILPSLVNSDGTINLSDALMANYLDFYTTGLITASDGETVTSFIKGVLDK